MQHAENGEEKFANRLPGAGAGGGEAEAFAMELAIADGDATVGDSSPWRRGGGTGLCVGIPLIGTMAQMQGFMKVFCGFSFALVGEGRKERRAVAG